MSTTAFTLNPSLTGAERSSLAQNLPGVAGAARWFWWIAGLSLVNTVMIHNGSETSFVVGLGFTLLADSIFQEVKFVAFVIDALAIGFFVLTGFFALRGYRWAFAVGAFFYFLDALIYLLAQDYMSLGFHALALFFIISGVVQLHTGIKHALAEKAAMAAGAVAAPPPVPAQA